MDGIKSRNRTFFRPLLNVTIVAILLLTSCKDTPLFERIKPAQSGINFSNDLTYNNDFNIFRYRNFYNGGGVGLGDFNNDGLLDIFLIGNMSSNRLYLNNGEFQFTDVTETAGVGGSQAFSTGVSIADVNGDGWMDIYVCNSGDIEGDEKINELFINNGDGNFSEKAEEYGLANKGFSTHAAFFDYDNDGDLDMYLMNNSYRAIGSFDQKENKREERDIIGGDKLFRNDINQFIDVSEEAGIYGSVIGFGLGVTVGDVNSDGWQDIYISNDFFERDYLYINNRDGGFDEVFEEKMKSTSAAAMGADMADLDNDGNPEIFVTDMLPDKNARIKTVTTFDSWDRYIDSYNNGYWHQFTRNTLHYNNGDGTFSDLGRYAGVEASDWSWASVIFDFQNDGYKDLFIANGIYQDLTNQDFLVYVSRDEVTMQITMGGIVDFETLIGYIPSNPIPNHAYINNGDLTFSNRSEELGLSEASFSSGSAYGDFDNDGDLDLIINNTNSPFFLYENKSDELYPENRYLRFVLNGEKGNLNAIGTRIKAFVDDKVFQLDNIPNRGFESSVDFRPLLGVGQNTRVDRLEIWWPSGKMTSLKDVPTNQELVLEESEGKFQDASAIKLLSSQPDYIELDTTQFNYRHTESEYSDFDRERLIFSMLSSEGPCMCTGDINNDGLDDIFVGGASGFLGQVYAQQSEGVFRNMDVQVFSRTRGSEDVSCALFDANGDGNIDLYVASGSNEFNQNVPEMNDRLFFGDGDFGFELVRQTLPAGRFESSSVVKPADYDGDGDIDLFVGIRSKPFYYGLPMNGYILKNDGKGTFTNISSEIAPELEGLGMITDASWTDLDKDNDLDLVIVGEWMPVATFINENGKFTSHENLIPNSNGWWNVIETADLNGDGFPDLIAGNHGKNSRFRATSEKPVTMFVKDFSGNGFVEQILCQYEGNKLYPMALKHDLSSQLPFIDSKYKHYESYKDQTISDIFSTTILADALVLEAEELATVLYMNNGDLTFTRMELPEQVQYSTSNAISIEDYNGDNIADILIGGNFYDAKPEVGRYDASYGCLLIGDGTGSFKFMPPALSGLVLDRQVRSIARIKTSDGYKILVANNDDYAQMFEKRE
jgi:hypothetical protein